MDRVHREAAEEAAAMTIGINVPFDLSAPSPAHLARQHTSVAFFEVNMLS